jgi:hypothetical protein
MPRRNAPCDKLLFGHQRKDQAKLQKAQLKANPPDPDDDPLGPIDEEEERDKFMAGIAQGWGGAPLVNSTMVPLRRRYERTRIKSMIGTASSSGGGNVFTVSGGMGRAEVAVS